MPLTEEEEDELKRLQLNELRRSQDQARRSDARRRRGRTLFRSAAGATILVGAAYLFKAPPHFVVAALVSVRCARDCWDWGHKKGGVVVGALAVLVALPVLFGTALLFVLALVGQLQPEKPIVFLFAWGCLLFWVALRIYDHLRFRRARAAALRQE